METPFVAVCFCLLAIGILPPSAETVPTTVNELEAEFKIFGQKYINFRKMPNRFINLAKKAALKKLWKMIRTNKWYRGPEHFYLKSLDPRTFKTGKGATLFEQLNDEFIDTDLKGIKSLSLFRDPAIRKDEVTGDFKARLDDIESFVKKELAKLSYKDASKVAYGYELFNGQDHSDPNNPDARKEYALIMMTLATN